MRWGRAVRRGLILGLLGAGPLFALPYGVIDSFVLPKLALLMFIVVAVAVIRGGEILCGARPQRTFVLVPVAAAIVPLLLTWPWSPYKGWALFGQYFRYTGVVPGVLLGALALLTVDAFPEGFRKPAIALTASATLVAVYGIVQSLGMDPIGWEIAPLDETAFVTIGNFNFAAGFLAMCLPLAIGSAWSEAGRVRAAFIASAVLIAAAVVLLDSQGGWGAAFGGGVLTLCLLGRTRWRFLPAAGVLTALLVAAAGAGIVALAASSPDAYVRLERNIQTRSDYWVTSAAMASNNIWVGRGPNSFAIASVKYRPAHNARTQTEAWTWDPHNVLLMNFASMGLVGAAGFIVLLLWMTHSGATAVRTRPSPLVYGLVGAVAAYVIQAQVSIDDITIRMALWTVIAGLALERRGAFADDGAQEIAVTQRGRVPVAVGLCVVGVLLALANAVRFPLADHYIRVGNETMSNGDARSAVDVYARGTGLRDDVYYRQTIGVQLGKAALRDRAQRPELTRLMTDEFSYLEGFPDPFAIVKYARLLHSLAELDPEMEARAVEQYARAHRLDPENPQIAIEMTDPLVVLGEGDVALDVLLSYSNISAEYPEYWGALAVAAAQAGDRVAAARYAEHALEVDPDDHRALIAQDFLGSLDG